MQQQTKIESRHSQKIFLLYFIKAAYMRSSLAGAIQHMLEAAFHQFSAFAHGGFAYAGSYSRSISVNSGPGFKIFVPVVPHLSLTV